jgi:arylamine N-acetyltransferase
MVHIDRFDHQIYTPDQVSQFLDRIALPSKYRTSPVLTDKSAANTPDGLAFATVLQKYFLANVPWENLDLHYSSHHTISLDPMHLFHKIVEKGMGRGGYCMENTAIFGTVLRSLGYDIMTTGGRVNDAVQPMAAGKDWKGPRYDGW